MSLPEILTAFNHRYQFVAAPVQLVSFWLSVSLPLVYVPLLFDGLREKVLPLFFGLLVLHAFTLYLGHGHRRRKA
ncbi:hypothetical protein [Haladaptatus sp. DYF46]|uniref:hypothetical protein n=1 Tax=Haladaptatus sp. DYF46 TaxID=2886041 RepID=UPI001E61273C|nr:hypothetical protein [Haladaptatus sp. DYF46]